MPDRDNYEQAIREWAFCIAEMPELNGLAMGKAVEAGKSCGVTSMKDISFDLWRAQAELEELRADGVEE